MTSMTAQTVAKPDVSTRLAFDRTRVAYERTMLAWVRTATSLITFGFSIYKFFQLQHLGGERTDRLVGPREFSLLLVSLGLASLLLAAVEHRLNMRELRAQSPEMPPRSLAGVVASLIAILGIAALIVMILHQ
jgi:putative membrane protein